MPLLNILIWLQLPNMISSTEDDNHLGIRLAFPNMERSKKRANPEEGGMKFTEDQVEVGEILVNIR